MLEVVCGLIAFVVFKHVKKRTRAMVGLVVVFIVYMSLNRVSKYKVHRVQLNAMNEVYILQTLLNGRSALFLIDTGYAGPLVLSKAYMATSDPVELPLFLRYGEIMRRIQNVSEDDEHGAINTFLQESNCYPFTSGCTMTLMGISSSQQQQADLLMCSTLKIQTCAFLYMAPPKPQIDADLFVTNSLKTSVHIMTNDFLIMHAPCLLTPSTLEFRVPPWQYAMIKQSFHFINVQFNGGAFVVPMSISGIEFHVVVDTGAPGPLSLNADVMIRVQQQGVACYRSDKKVLYQEGVNNEKVCSEIVECDLTFIHKTFRVPVFVNDQQTHGVDGFVGLGFLRAFDLLIMPQSLGFRKNRIKFKSYKSFANAASDGSCIPNLQCQSS